MLDVGGFQYPPATQLVEVSLEGWMRGRDLDLAVNNVFVSEAVEYDLRWNGDAEAGLDGASPRDKEDKSQSLSS